MHRVIHKNVDNFIGEKDVKFEIVFCYICKNVEKERKNIV